MVVIQSSLAQLQLTGSTRQDILGYFENTWSLTEMIFSALQSDEAFYRPPDHHLRHPLVFYFCHPAVFYINKLRVAGLIDNPVNLRFEQLFEAGVDEMSWDDMSKNEMKWPEIEEIREYRKTVYQLIRNMIETHPEFSTEKQPFLQNSKAWAFVMAMEHERIHLETSSVLMRELPLQFVKTPLGWPDLKLESSQAKAPDNALVTVESGHVTLGKPKDFPTFGWDNEYGHREDSVRAFEVSRFLISNGEFLEFVIDGGYREEKYWSIEGWRWRIFRNAKWPAFWLPTGPAGLHEFNLRTVFDVVKMQNTWPAVVNFHEATAYASWKSEKDKSKFPYRLVSESEIHRLRQKAGTQDGSKSKVKNGDWNIGFVNGSETSVDAHVHGGFGDVFGNVWQWCEDEFNPLHGFRVHPYYDDFSTPCFDGKHQMILGGSFISTGDEASQFARFHFRPHFYQHAGFRLARSLSGSSRSDAVRLSESKPSLSTYESKDLLNQYMLLHFGSGKDVFPFASGPKDALEFPKRCADIVIEHARKLGVPMGRALDIGCAVGGAGFALAREFKEVVGVDLSSSFIATANQMRSTGQMSYFCKDEGELGFTHEAKVPAEIDRTRVSFRQADACSLPAEFIDFDAVLMANLLCRLPSPRSCLARMGGGRGIVKRGGLLVILSPASWLEDYTHHEAWLGGFEKDGKPVHTTDTLREILSEEFECVHEDDIPLMIREHARKYQYIVSHLMVWRRK
jgi:5-histidylcysteine sulfoxide synthase/putative 4-mercaptohistidine N1-methyltranferase